MIIWGRGGSNLGGSDDNFVVRRVRMAGVALSLILHHCNGLGIRLWVRSFHVQSFWLKGSGRIKQECVHLAVY